MIFFIIIFPSIAFVILYIWLKKKASELPGNGPKSIHLEKCKTTIVCAGDSLTHGSVSYNFVDELQVQFPNYQFVNAGINSDTSFNLLNRIHDIIDCRPEMVFLLIGSNDVRADAYKKIFKALKKEKSLPHRPSIEKFVENLTQIIEKLNNAHIQKICLISLPMMGEDVSQEINAKIKHYSHTIKELADKYNLGYIPLFEKHYEILKNCENPCSEKNYYFYRYTAILLHYLFGRSWQSISNIFNLKVHSDTLHLNEFGSKPLLNGINQFIKLKGSI